MGTTLKLTCGLVLAAAFLAMASVAAAGPFEDGQAAYRGHDYATALQVWQPLADHGDAKAQPNLGNIYVNGQGVPQDYAEAAKWFQLAADQGLALGQDVLGNAYLLGEGVPQDYEEAVRWVRLAADQGLVQAQIGMAFMYIYGRGVPQDYVLAYMWVNLAAARGDPNVSRLRDKILGHMSSTQVEEAQRLAREWKPTGPSGSSAPR